MIQIQDPPTIEEVLKSYGIDPDQLPLTDDRGYYICPFHYHEGVGCSFTTPSEISLSTHCSSRHDQSVMQGLSGHISYDEAWEDALIELVRYRGYSLPSIASTLPSHTGVRSVRDDARDLDIDWESSVAGGPNSKLQHYLPEEVGLSPMGEGSL